MDSNLTIRATERYANGWADSRGAYASGWRWDHRVERLFQLRLTIFRTEAENRGYCMPLWDSHVPRGFGHAGLDGRI